MGRRLAKTLPILVCLVVLAGATTDCYSTGDGTAPPLDQLYYPVGLQVSAGGTALYAVNSDFDLQYNGGTFQSYDLGLIRQHAVKLIADPSALEIPLIDESKRLAKGTDCRAGSATPISATCLPMRSSHWRCGCVHGSRARSRVMARSTRVE